MSFTCPAVVLSGISPRDIQSKLKSLFTNDYTKHHRTFRPSRSSEPALVLKRIRSGRGNGRVSKSSNNLRPHAYSSSDTSAAKKNPNSRRDLFDVAAAFKNYVQASETEMPSQPLLEPIMESSQPNTPSRLLLDGSVIPLSLEKCELKTRDSHASQVPSNTPLAPNDVGAGANESSVLDPESAQVTPKFSVSNLRRKETF